MSNTKTEHIFSNIQKLFFEELGYKFRPGTLKNLTNFLYIIFEKAGYNIESISKSYIKIYDDLVKDEIRLANITSNDNVLVIGCGSIPSTAVILARETDTQITAIDIDSQATKKAVRYIKNHNLQDNITVKTIFGTDYPIKDFDVIFILYGVKHQSNLFQYLYDGINYNTRVIYRASKDAGSRNQLDKDQISKLFIIKDMAQNRSFGLMDSYLLLKKQKKV